MGTSLTLTMPLPRRWQLLPATFFVCVTIATTRMPFQPQTTLFRCCIWLELQHQRTSKLKLCVGATPWGLVQKAKPHPRISGGVLGNKCLTMTYFHRRTSTIIGAKAFHGPVRDGKAWDHLAMVVKRNGFALCACVGKDSGPQSQLGQKHTRATFHVIPPQQWCIRWVVLGLR